MLEIIQTDNFERFGITPPSELGEAHLIEAKSGEETSGFAVFCYSEEMLRLTDVSAGGDLALFDGLVRTVLFKGLLRGIASCSLDCSTEDESLKKLGFLKDSVRIIDSNAFLGGCESCRHAK